MNATQQDLWSRFKARLVYDAKSGLALDTSRLNFEPTFLAEIEPRMQQAFAAMEKLERGEIANPDENRMVGHYWLRAAELAPSAEIKNAISDTIHNIKKFTADVHAGRIAPPEGGTFKQLIVIGIGGSALGPQFVNQALGSAHDPMKISFFDNTDPDGMAKVLQGIDDLRSVLAIVISKSGGTKETRNGQLVLKAAFEAAQIPFAKHFVAVTGQGSELAKTATTENWLAQFPMWDWVGGRTSEFSAVGLLPMALQGFDIEEVLRGAREMDQLTRNKVTAHNPAAMLALGWYHCGCGKGGKDMVVLPYKDRLELFSRYLQQLVMESLGKERDLNGAVVHQGIAVYGNKGSTDQHAYVQQLRDGLNNFFAVFIEVLEDLSPKSRAASAFTTDTLEVEKGTTCGDYLIGFYLGTRSALFEKGRESISVSIPRVSEFYVGMLVALFERTVGLYASLININAYHQPGVEAGKKAAGEVLKLQLAIENFLRESKSAHTVEDVAKQVHSEGDVETAFKILRHLAANKRVSIESGKDLFADRYFAAR